jgi:hypothetical protein
VSLWAQRFEHKLETPSDQQKCCSLSFSARMNNQSSTWPRFAEDEGSLDQDFEASHVENVSTVRCSTFQAIEGPLSVVGPAFHFQDYLCTSSSSLY